MAPSISFFGGRKFLKTGNASVGSFGKFPVQFFEVVFVHFVCTFDLNAVRRTNKLPDGVYFSSGDGIPFVVFHVQ